MTFYGFNKSFMRIFATILIISLFSSFSLFKVQTIPIKSTETRDDSIKVSSTYKNETVLEFGVPTILGDISEPPDNNVFGGSALSSLYVLANFSGNNGTLWIENKNLDVIWTAVFVEDTIQTVIILNDSSHPYRLMANSSTPGVNTLFYTFDGGYGEYGNIGLLFVVFTLFGAFFCSILLIPAAFIKAWKNKRALKN